MKKQLLQLWLLCLMLLIPGSTASAQSFPRQNENVYTGAVYDGVGYSQTFYPNRVSTVYLLADVENVLEARLTQVYYWPLTSEYKADWGVLDQPIQGTLEILQGERLVASLQPTRYAMITDRDQVQPTGIVSGAVADSAYQKYQAAYQEYYGVLLPKYEQDLLAYQNAAADNVQRAFQGKPVVQITPPNKPASPLPMVGQPGDGFILQLSVGDYQMQIRDLQGKILPGSIKKLEVFAPLRKGVEYQILPESQWTQPIISDQPGSTIYWGPDPALYLEPFEATEYHRGLYNLLKNPQSPDGDQEGEIWIEGSPLREGQIRLLTRGQTTLALPIKEYIVNQMPGSGLGYTITEKTSPLPIDDPTIQIPSFQAIKLDSASLSTGISFQFVSPSGQVLPQSARDLRRFRPIGSLAIFIFPASSLLIGIGILFVRRRLTAI